MYYFLSIALILGGAFFAWKPHVWLELTQCRCGSCKSGPWAVIRTRVTAISCLVLGIACLIQLVFFP